MDCRIVGRIHIIIGMLGVNAWIRHHHEHIDHLMSRDRDIRPKPTSMSKREVEALNERRSGRVARPSTPRRSSGSELYLA
jgi:hypothetical protein